MTNRKALEFILESLPEGIVGHDQERRITYFNHAAEAITGWPRDQVLGKDCHEAFGSPFCGKHCPFIEGLPTSHVTKTYPLNIVTMKGEPKQLCISLSTIADDDGKIIGHTALLRDVPSLIWVLVLINRDTCLQRMPVIRTSSCRIRSPSPPAFSSWARV